jgi:hypothetical protein
MELSTLPEFLVNPPRYQGLSFGSPAALMHWQWRIPGRTFTLYKEAGTPIYGPKRKPGAVRSFYRIDYDGLAKTTYPDQAKFRLAIFCAIRELPSGWDKALSLNNDSVMELFNLAQKKEGL